nr:unnamed protein product [Digitaria exilis]
MGKKEELGEDGVMEEQLIGGVLRRSSGDVSGELWDWHKCVNCRGSSDFQCLCCPLYSVCHDCIGHVQFVQLGKQNKGFCSMCLNRAILMEKKADPDPDVEKTDDRDEEIARILFTDYWEITRDKEHLTLVDLEEASVFLRLNSKGGVNSDEHVLADNDVNDQKNPCKQNEVNTLLKKKSKRKKTFIGWGSEELIGFLLSVGKDTEKPLDKLEIAGVVKDYIKQKNLYHDAKKVCFLCDDRLQPLFARRKVRCKMIRKFLADHLASSAVSEDENSYGSEDDDTPVMKKRPLNSLEPKIAKRVSERSKRCFAALVHKNINLIYLRRTLVINLLSDPDTFERKVVGCFVRLMVAQPVHSYVKSTKAFVLGRVTGIKKASKEYKLKGTCTSTNILLCLTGPLADVTISMLSDEDFEEDECSVLISSVKEGLLERVTIAEFEEKVATVHTDIVKHWIERELVRLEKNIDRAQNKGLPMCAVVWDACKDRFNLSAVGGGKPEIKPDSIPQVKKKANMPPQGKKKTNLPQGKKRKNPDLRYEKFNEKKKKRKEKEKQAQVDGKENQVDGEEGENQDDGEKGENQGDGDGSEEEDDREDKSADEGETSKAAVATDQILSGLRCTPQIRVLSLLPLRQVGFLLPLRRHVGFLLHLRNGISLISGMPPPTAERLNLEEKARRQEQTRNEERRGEVGLQKGIAVAVAEEVAEAAAVDERTNLNGHAVLGSVTPC